MISRSGSREQHWWRIPIFEGWLYSNQQLFAGDLGRTCWSLGLNRSHLATVGQFTRLYFLGAMLEEHNQLMFINKDIEVKWFKIIQLLFFWNINGFWHYKQLILETFKNKSMIETSIGVQISFVQKSG